MEDKPILVSYCNSAPLRGEHFARFVWRETSVARATVTLGRVEIRDMVLGAGLGYAETVDPRTDEEMLWIKMRQPLFSLN